MRWLSSTLIVICALSATARAQDNYTWTFTVQAAPGAAGHFVCTRTGKPPGPDAQAVDIKVDAPSAAAFTIKVDGATQTLQPNPGPPAFQELDIPLTDKEQKLVASAATTVDMTTNKCDEPLGLKKPAQESQADDVAAAKQLRTHSVNKELPDALPGAHWYSVGERHLQYLVHLPSGQPAFPMPSRVTEGQDVQVVLLVPQAANKTVTLQVDGCGDVNTFRADLTTTSENALHGKSDKFALLPVGQYFSCGSGTVTYTLKTQTIGGDGKSTDTTLSTTKLTFRPKYHIAAIAALGWDTARRVTYASETPTGFNGPIIAKHNDKVGPSLYMGAEWMIGGVDYEDMQWWNYFANVFIAADPTSPTTNVMAGISLTPTGGAGLTLGVTYHEGQVLESVKPGDPVMGSAVPARQSWNERGQGWFIGLNVDSRIYDAIIKRFTQKT